MTWLLPGLLVSEKTVSRDEQMTPLNFPHLVERLSLLVIITFGEMIIGIAPYFTRHTLSIWTVLIFLIVANLFMTYIVEIDHLIDDEQEEATGNRAIYFHYFIFFGLSFTTVSLSFLENSQANYTFTTLVLYLGIGLLLLGTLLLNHYNKASHLLTKSVIVKMALCYGIGLVVSLAFPQMGCYGLMILAFLVTTAIDVLMVGHNIHSTRQLTKE